MSRKMVDVMLHLDEATSHDKREALRAKLLALDGVFSADVHDEKPHLLVVEYDPDTLPSSRLLEVTRASGLHAELVGL